MRRSDLNQFAALFFRLPVEDYECAAPWLGQNTDEALLEAFGCEAIDLYCPVRSPGFVAHELQHQQKRLSEDKALLTQLLCGLCNAVCSEPVCVKLCCHRFCNSCIQKWIRNGHTLCPRCAVKLPSRRVIKPDPILTKIIQTLFEHTDQLHQFNRTHCNLRKGDDVKETGSVRESSSPSASGASNDDEDAMVDSEASSSSGSSCVNDLVSSEPLSEGSEDLDEVVPRVGVRRGRPRVKSRSTPPRTSGMTPTKMGGATHPLDELYADDSGYLEIFLVCLNTNLPAAVCSMARELSKRPLRLRVGATTRDAALLLAEKLVRDVLGPFDVNAIIPDLSFVRNGELWPAVSNVPLSEVCRQLTENRGPIALRYLLSDRLFSLCERIETAY